jgi:NarL family two-component system response regulator LiaR
MPGAATEMVIQAALQQNPDCRVIIISAFMQDPQLFQKIQNGTFSLLTKPFDASQLREAVNLALAAKEVLAPKT